jgi:hypothetical protein
VKADRRFAAVQAQVQVRTRDARRDQHRAKQGESQPGMSGGKAHAAIMARDGWRD